MSFHSQATIPVKGLIVFLIIGVVSLSLPSASIAATTKNPNNTNSHGYYSYVDKNLVSGILNRYEDIDHDRIAALLGISQLRSELEKGGYYDMFLKADKIKFLQAMKTKHYDPRIIDSIVKSEQNNNWESVRLATASLNQSIAGLKASAGGINAELTPALKVYLERQITICTHWPSDLRTNMDTKSQWLPGDKEALYKFWIPPRFSYHQQDPEWSHKPELPAGRKRFNVGENTGPFTELYYVNNFRKFCNKVAPTAQVQDITLSTILDALIVYDGIILIAKAGAIGLAAGTRVLEKAGAVGGRVVTKDLAAETGGWINIASDAKPSNPLFVKPKLQFKMGELTSITWKLDEEEITFNLERMFRNVNLSTRDMYDFVEKIKNILRAYVKDNKFLGEYYTPGMAQGIMDDVTISSLCGDTLARCHIDDAKIEIDKALLHTHVDNQGLFSESVLHEIIHHIVARRTGHAVHIPPINLARGEIGSLYPFEDGFTAMFTVEAMNARVVDGVKLRNITDVLGYPHEADLAHAIMTKIGERQAKDIFFNQGMTLQKLDTALLRRPAGGGEVGPATEAYRYIINNPRMDYTTRIKQATKIIERFHVD